jgi:hypothetical protein
MRDRALKIVAALMVVVFPLSMTAADMNAAFLHASGAVTLNGARVPESTTVFAGDEIQTSKDAAVSLTLKGSSVLLPPQSAAVYQADAIELRAGTVVVNTTQGMAARTPTVTVTPAAQGTAKFQVTRTADKVLIAALRGTVSVSDASGAKTVSEGSSVTVPVPEPTPQAGGGAGGAGGGLSTAALVAIGAAVAAAAAAIAVATSGTPSGSPSTP